MPLNPTNPINSYSMASVSDAMQRHYVHKVPTTTIKIADLSQQLSLNTQFTVALPFVSRFMGNPTSITLFVKSDTAAVLTVSLSPNGDTYYPTAMTITLTANSGSIVTLSGAGYLSISTNADINAFSSHVVANF